MKREDLKLEHFDLQPGDLDALDLDTFSVELYLMEQLALCGFYECEPEEFLYRCKLLALSRRVEAAIERVGGRFGEQHRARVSEWLVLNAPLPSAWEWDWERGRPVERWIRARERLLH
jgi:hypothetical protein